MRVIESSKITHPECVKLRSYSVDWGRARRQRMLRRPAGRRAVHEDGEVLGVHRALSEHVVPAVGELGARDEGVMARGAGVQAATP